MKKFKTESQKLLDLMINSIYTNREIFLRELISNASDAVDKLHFMSLTDKKMDFSKESFQINVSSDKEARTIVVSDNGVGMTRDELDKNLGTIAHSDSMEFKAENAADQGDNVDIIGQFGVGFYSVFMVAKKVQVISRSVSSGSADDANIWSSNGVDGYEIKPSHREERGTDIIVYLKDDEGENNYSEFLEEYKLRELITKYSNYVRYPIKMEVTKSREKERPADAGDDYTPEYEDYKEVETINSITPIWKRSGKDIKKGDYAEFYKSNFHDFADPAAHFSIHAEGTINYDALIYIPGQAPFDLYSRDYKKGLQLYNSNVLIMDKCEELVPDYFNFIKGVVDSQDLTLNISRETLQHNTQLVAISRRIEKKVKSELAKMRDKNREDYEKFFKNFGRVLKFGIYSTYGGTKDTLADLLMFYSASAEKMVTLDEYIEAASTSGEDNDDKKIKAEAKSDNKDKKEEKVEAELVDADADGAKDDTNDKKKFIYYAAGVDSDQLSKLPAVTTLLKRGYDVLLLTEDIDEFCIQAMMNYNDYEFKNVSGADLGLDSEEDKKKTEKAAEKNKDLLEAMKKYLGDDVARVTVSTRVSDAPSCLSAEGPVSFEMERVMAGTPGAEGVSATRVLELNPKHKVFKTLVAAQEAKDTKKVKLYTNLLYNQALLVEGLPLKDPVEFSKNIAKLMQ